jgi:hypothetical protein
MPGTAQRAGRPVARMAIKEARRRQRCACSPDQHAEAATAARSRSGLGAINGAKQHI